MRSVLSKKWLAALLAMLASSMSLAAPPRLAPEVAFFSTAFPELLSSFRAMLDTMEFCNHEPLAACGASHAMPAQGLADMAYFLGRITTFPTTSRPPDRAQQERLKSSADAEGELAAQRKEYESKLREFDTQFLGHYGALLHVCADSLERSDRTAVHYRVIRDVVSTNYWYLLPPDSRKFLDDVDRVGAKAIQDFRGSPKTRCTAMLTLGKKLLAPYGRRLKPYAGDGMPDQSYANRFGESILFTWGIALELEAHVRPAVLDEVDARESQSETQTPK